MKEFALSLAIMLGSVSGFAVSASPALAQDMSNGAANFYKSDRVDVKSVTFQNQYNMKVAGHLFTPKDMQPNAKLAAIVVGHPMGAVKEQSADLYATKMAEQGFVTLSIDLSFWGESEGTPGHLVAPDIYSDDFSAAVDFLSTQSFVDQERIGALGICGSGSFVISAAKIDPRMKAIATVSMYDMGAAFRNGLKQSVTLEQRKDFIQKATAQRLVEFAGGETQYIPGTVNELTESTDPIQREFFDFYRTSRGAYTPKGQQAELTTKPTLSSVGQVHELLPVQRHRDDLTAADALHHGRQGAFAGVQRGCLQAGRRAEGTLHRAERRSRRSLRPGEPDPVRKADRLLPREPELVIAGPTQHPATRHARQPGVPSSKTKDHSRCNGETTAETLATAETASWGSVFALTLCVATLIASEFMPVSLLTPIASDLGVSEGTAGQAIAVSGLFAVLTSLSISSVTRGIDRRTVLLGLTLAMILSGVMVAFAPNTAVFMAGRALVGVVIGGFWSMSAATVMRLVPEAQVPRALGLLNGGNALAVTIAAPLGSFLGQYIGWRGAFFAVVPLAAITLAWLFVSLPSMPAKTERSGTVFRVLRRRTVPLGMAAVSLFFMGQFVLQTYLRPFLETVTGVNTSVLSLILLVIGGAGVLGTYLIGLLLKTRLYSLLIVLPLLMAVIGGALTLLGHSPFATTSLLAMWGLIGTAAPVGWWTWLSKALPDDAEAGGGLMVAVVQLAIALGASSGGWLFDHEGYQATFAFSALVLVIGAAVAGLCAYRVRSDISGRSQSMEECLP